MSTAEDATPAERYGLALMSEEIGEVIQIFGNVLQVIGKAGRFGLDTPGALDPITGHVDMTITPRGCLVKELGDIMAAVDYLAARGVVDGDAVLARRNDKLLRLLDPDSRDNLGRRLAP